MRLSVIRSDPGFRADAGQYEVYYRGELRRDVITADEEKKEILCYVLDDNGRPTPHPDRPGTYLTELRRGGEVHIRRKTAILASRDVIRRSMERLSSGVRH